MGILELESMSGCDMYVIKMQMTFFDDYHFTLFLDDWHVENSEQYWGSLIALLLFSIAVEVFREMLKFPYVRKLFLLGSNENSMFSIRRLIGNFIKAFIYFWIICGAFLMMLAVMTYSTGVFLVVCIGSSVGFIIAKSIEDFAMPMGNSKQSMQPLNKVT